jgi:2'-5' RNA ligase superfamily protein/F like protein
VRPRATLRTRPGRSQFASERHQPSETVSVSPKAHNRVLKAAQKRVDKLEPRLARVIEPILRRAGDEAAARFKKYVTDHLVAAASENASVSPAATMVCLVPRPDEADAIATPDGDPPEILHCTLAFLGDVDGSLDEVAAALLPVAAQHAPLAGQVGGVGEFPGVALLLPDVPGLVELRTDAVEALTNAGIDYSREHGFVPHITIGADQPSDAGGEPLHFDAIHVVRGNDESVEIPLTGTKPLTAAGATPDWSAPFPNELIDVDALVAEILAKTGPVREAMIRNTMEPALEAAGLSWDVTNPLTAKVLAESASQVTHIAETTQANVMKIVGKSYENGLSIPQTAGAIRQGMAEASKSRATMIARTELARAANGGSLVATQLVANALGTDYSKTWETAPGALYPRHEDYPDLDGQTVGLDEMFIVGDSELQYPGDPSGEPGETINCRCSMTYAEPGGGTGIADAESPPDFADGEEVVAEGGGGGLGFAPAVPTASKAPEAQPVQRVVHRQHHHHAPTRSPVQAVNNTTSTLDAQSKADIDAALQSIAQALSAPGSEDAEPAVTAKVVGRINHDGQDALGLFDPHDMSIEVKRLQDDRYSTFTHEYGHALDSMIGNHELGDLYATFNGDGYGLRPWADAVKETSTYQDILGAMNDAVAAARESEAGGLTPNSVIYVHGVAYTAKQLLYVLDTQELFARSFVQWMSLRDERLATHVGEELAKDRQSLGSWYWPPDEFAQVASAMTDFFRERGLLVE